MILTSIHHNSLNDQDFSRNNELFHWMKNYFIFRIVQPIKESIELMENKKVQQLREQEKEISVKPTPIDIKMIVMGSGGVGKSALTLRYTYSKFIEKYDPTIEDSYRKYTEFEGDPFVLNILDQAGRDEYSAMRDQYMKQSEAFMICFSITDPSSFQDAAEIHEQLLRSLDSDEIPVVLVGTKCDLEEERGVSFDEGKQMALEFGNCSYVETSAKDMINVNEAFEILIREYKNSKNPENDDEDEYKDDDKKYKNSIYDPRKEKKKKYCEIM